MTQFAAAVVVLVLLSATAAGAGTFKASPGTFGPYSPPPRMAPPKPSPSPAHQTPRQSEADTGAFKPWKPSMRTDSTRGGVDAYPGAKKPKGYISPY